MSCDGYRWRLSLLLARSCRAYRVSASENSLAVCREMEPIEAQVNKVEVGDNGFYLSGVLQCGLNAGRTIISRT